MIAILGAGSIGCYVGGMLAASGVPVTLIGRDAMVAALSNGLTVTAMDGVSLKTKPKITTDYSTLATAEMILVCVKSADTSEAGRIIRAYAPVSARVISLQNGLTNADALQREVGADRFTAGMVGFNVVRQGEAHFVQATDGEIILDQSGHNLVTQLSATPIKVLTHQNMQGVQWSKLLMNLNNALNALSGIGLRAQLENREWRSVLAACISEGLAVAQAEHVQLEKLGRVHPKQLPMLLRLPDFIFLRIAQSMLRISPTARSSMADDYALHRPSEVSWLNGYIVERARARGLRAPVNANVVKAINRAFASKERPPLGHAPRALLA